MPEPIEHPSLFLSYARGDDEPFVKRLYERLVSEGFEAWWDRERMPSRSLTFLKEIREAVRAADRLVVVIGPRCVSSDYCRAEWQAALAEAKVVTPLLRLGEFALLPPELGNLHCPDFTDDAAFEESIGELLRVLSEPLPIPGRLLGGVPDVPPRYQPRPDATSALAQAVLVDEREPVVLSGPQRVSVLYGMGGTGKSVLAAAFARATTTRRSFADGIYWLDVGQQATPLGLAAQVGRLVGTPPESHGELASCVTDLTGALEDQSALVVLDNLWQIEVLEPLIDVVGSSCRMLVTTRIGELVAATGARAVELLALTPAAALQHLADWAGVPPEDLPDDAAQVAAACGELPFALALNGAMHAQGVSWADLLAALKDADIDYAEQRFSGYEHPTVLASIKVSMDALEGEDPLYAARFCELAAFLGEGGIPEAAITVLWSHTGDLRPRDVSKLLGKLAGRALLRLEGKDGERRVLVHDLQRDYLLRGTDAGALNTAVLAAYRATLGRGGDWVDLPRGDAYIWEHLIEHLIAGGELDQARRATCDLAFLARRIEESGSFGAEADLAAVRRARPDDAVVGQLATRLRQWATTLADERGTVGLASTVYARLGIPGADPQALGEHARGSWLRRCWGLSEESGALQRVLAGHERRVNAVAFSPDGSRLASASRDGSVRLWDARSGAELAHLGGYGDDVRAVAFSPDGARLASASHSSTARLWDAQTGAELADLAADDGAVSAVVFSPDGARLASGSVNSSVRLWDAQSGAKLARVAVDGEGYVNAVAFSPDGVRLASGTSFGRVSLWDARRGAELARLEGHERRVTALAFSPDGALLASAAADCSVRLWDTLPFHRGAELGRLEGHEDEVGALAFSPDGALLASASKDCSVRLWDAQSGVQLAYLDSRGGGVNGVAFSPDGVLMASASEDGSVRLWDVHGGTQSARGAGHGDRVNEVAFSPDGTRLASASEDGSVRLWDAHSGAELARLEGYQHGVESVAFSPDGARLAFFVGGDGVHVWEAGRGAHLSRLLLDRAGAVNSLAFSPDGARLASTSRRRGGGGSVRLWDAQSGAQLASLDSRGGGVHGVAFSPDGARLASAQGDSSVRVWDAQSGAQLARLEGHGDRVNAVAFSPDGAQLTSGSLDQTVRIWDAQSGAELARLEGHGSQVNAVAFSPDGARLASASDDGRVRLWDAGSGGELARVALGTAVSNVVWSGERLAVGAGRDVIVFDVVG